MGKINNVGFEKRKKVSGIAPLQPPTLAPFRAWGIKQELVVPLGTKVSKSFLLPNSFSINRRIRKLKIKDRKSVANLLLENYIRK